MKILKKLLTKEAKYAKKLSDKEKMLKEYLSKEEAKPELLTLNEESTTRKYGELAAIPEAELARLTEEYLKG